MLSFTAQAQANTATLPQNAIPTVYGKAPYAGEAATLCTGFGGNSTDLVAAGQATGATQATGTYGATSGSLNVFADGLASGSLTFNSNDDVGNTTGLSNYDCDFQQLNNQVYADGTTNNEALLTNNQFYNPYTSNASLTCRDADAGLTAPTPTPIGADEVNSSVVWGTSDQNGYTLVTGVASPALLGGAFLPPGETATCTSLQESAASGKVTLTKPTSPLVWSGTTVTEPYTITNTSEGACTVTASMPTVTGAPIHGNTCTISLSPVAPYDASLSPISFGVESFAAATGYTSVTCMCTGSSSPGAATAKSTLVTTSTNCELTGPASTVLTCEN